MRAWLSKLWVRNVIGAVVALAAVAVVIFTGLSESWATYRHTVVPGAVVPAGQSGEAGGYTWKVAGDKVSEPQSEQLWALRCLPAPC